MGTYKLHITKDEWASYCYHFGGALYKRAKQFNIPLKEDYTCECGKAFNVEKNTYKKKVTCPECAREITFHQLFKCCNLDGSITTDNIREKLGYKLYETNKSRYTFYITKTNKKLLETLANESGKTMPEIINSILSDELKRYNTRKSKRKARGSDLYSSVGGAKL